MEQFNLEEYLSNGIENIVKGIIKASLKNPKASKFIVTHEGVSKKARLKRMNAEKNGEHIPPFIIASITDKCNLHCKGCYARANHSCTDGYCGEEANPLMTSSQWGSIFSQASDLGTEFILLAGGEPFVRKDVLETAGAHKDIVFPIFTNGTMIDNTYMQLLDKSRNLLPILSIEGNRETTDKRRGNGVYDKLQATMNELKSRGILFGASVTVTTENMHEVLSDDFVQTLKNSGVKAIIYVEYVPVDSKSKELAIDDEQRKWVMKTLNELRQNESEMLFIAFPGDEKSSGGCLAAGRGFFHINAHGGAEPCPFSPFSDTSLKKMSLKDALHSPLFTKLQQGGNLIEEHTGGCVLFEQKEQVQKILAKSLS